MKLLPGQAKRLGTFENGEIDPTDATQVEIYCSWPELMAAPEKLVNKLNRNMGFLKIADRRMSLSDWAIKINDLKAKRMIPGQIQQRHLRWDGLDIRVLMRNLRLLQQYGTVDIYNLPGYETDHPAVLTSDAAGHCFLDDTPVGRQISQHTGRVVHINDIKEWDQVLQKQSRQSILTPARLFRQGVDLCGIENLPDQTTVTKRIPEEGYCTLRARCIYCGATVKIRGLIKDERPHYEVDYRLACPHLQVRVKEYLDGNGGRFSRLHVQHYQDPIQFRALRQAEADKRGGKK